MELMTVTAVLDLGQRLERARSRRFVGRTAELELFAARLEAAAAGDTTWDLFSVLWVHGPGGIGKSTLLSAYAEATRKAGFTVLHIDGGRIRPTPAGIRASVPDSLGNRSVVMIDAAERLEAAEDWLREEFLPTLPAGTLVVIAGRRPPGERWRSDPGWRDLLRVVSLRNLLPEAVRTLLEVEQIPGALLEQVMALTHGHPLALSLLIDAVRRCDTGGEVPATLGELPDLVAALLRRLVDQAPTGRHRAALQVSAHAPMTTEPVLRAVLADSDAQEVSELWEWLRDLTIMEDSQAGIRPHEVARDILEADLRWRDPDAYADIHRRVRGHAVDQVKASARNPEALQHAVADLLFLVRDHPVAGVGWDWDAFGEPPGECVPSEPDGLDHRHDTGSYRVLGRRNWSTIGYTANRRRSGCFATPAARSPDSLRVCPCISRYLRTSRLIPEPRRCGVMRSSTIPPGRGNRSWLGVFWSTAIPTKLIRVSPAPCSGPGISATSCFDHRPPGTSLPITPISTTGTPSSTTGTSFTCPRPTIRSAPPAT